MSQVPASERAFFVGGGGRSPPGTGETVAKTFGIVLGSALGLALLLGGAYLLYRWWQRRQQARRLASTQ